jgi:hypothetical protein
MIAGIRAFFAIVSRFMGRLWLTVLYFTLVLPFGLLARTRAARERSGNTEVAWTTRHEHPADLANARKQF